MSPIQEVVLPVHPRRAAATAAAAAAAAANPIGSVEAAGSEQDKHDDKDKGTPIRVVNGTYAGSNGWLDLSRKNGPYTAKMVYLILETTVRQGSRQAVQESRVRINKANIVEKAHYDSPSSFVEAAILQHQKLNQGIRQLAMRFVQHGITADDIPEVIDIFEAELFKALDEFATSSRNYNVVYHGPRN